MVKQDHQGLIQTGITGLDRVLKGGLPTCGTFLLQGSAGTGKTTMALEFLLQGIRQGEEVLFVSLAQTRQRLEQIARSHGWSLDGMCVWDAHDGRVGDEQVIVHSVDVEFRETLAKMLEAFEEIRPRRAVIDALAVLRLMARDPHVYRQELLRMQLYFNRMGISVLYLDSLQQGDEAADVVDGIIRVEQNLTAHGTLRRHLQLIKLRGQPFVQGRHDMKIRTGGVEIFPRFDLDTIRQELNGGAPPREEKELLCVSVDTINELLGGGLHHRSSTLIIGGPGTGKSTLIAFFAHAAAAGGRHPLIYLFDEHRGSFLERAASLDMDLGPYLGRGEAHVRYIGADEFSPVEFAQLIRQDIEEQDAGFVAIDSLTGYIYGIAQERRLLIQMRELVDLLRDRGVCSVFSASHSSEGSVEVSYLADALILLRHVELDGQVKKAIAVLKKRRGPHSAQIHELCIEPGAEGVRLGSRLDRHAGLFDNWTPPLHPDREG